jgi:hypothetical protein
MLLDRLRRQGIDAAPWADGSFADAPSSEVWLLEGGVPGFVPEGVTVLSAVDPPRSAPFRAQWTNFLTIPPVAVRFRSMFLESITRDLLVHGLAMLHDQTVVVGGASEWILPLARTLRAFRCRPLVVTDNEFSREMARLQGFDTESCGTSLDLNRVSAAYVDASQVALEAKCRIAGVPLILQSWSSWSGHDVRQADDGYALSAQRFYEHLFPSAWSDALFPVVLEAMGRPFSAMKMAPTEAVP